MSDDTERTKLHPLAAAALILFAAGAIGSVWLGDWRYGVTGLVAMILCAVAGAAS